MTEEEIEDVAIKSALNMGPAQDMFHPDYGWIMQDGKITEVGEEFFRNPYKLELVCSNPREEVVGFTTCCMCDGPLVKGTCVQDFCLANPSHEKWEVPQKTSLLSRLKILILSLFLTGCSSMPSDSFNNPVWDCTGSSYESKVRVYAPDEQTAINQAELAIEKFHVYNNGSIICKEEK